MSLCSFPRTKVVLGFELGVDIVILCGKPEASIHAIDEIQHNIIPAHVVVIGKQSDLTGRGMNVRWKLPNRLRSLSAGR
ncbi:MAG: hypothetical protein IID36_02670 [Planctomycetes bacterium]|nr:hypothetical protein [Planctomycetota bacterium]